LRVMVHDVKVHGFSLEIVHRSGRCPDASHRV
jgi:hypothetical protein